MEDILCCFFGKYVKRRTGCLFGANPTRGCCKAGPTSPVDGTDRSTVHSAVTAALPTFAPSLEGLDATAGGGCSGLDGTASNDPHEHAPSPPRLTPSLQSSDYGSRPELETLLLATPLSMAHFGSFSTQAPQALSVNYRSSRSLGIHRSGLLASTSGRQPQLQDLPRTTTLPQLLSSVSSPCWVGRGAQGAVVKALWRSGAPVGVKWLVTDGINAPAACMEALLAKMLAHPYLVQTFDCGICRLGDSWDHHASPGGPGGASIAQPNVPWLESPALAAASLPYSANDAKGRSDEHLSPMTAVDSFEGQAPSGFASHRPVDCVDVLKQLGAAPGKYVVQIVSEWCDEGTLHGAIRRGVFRPQGRRTRMWALRALLRTAREVALGMCHLHSLNIIHGDLKPSNVLLRSSRVDSRGFVAKVADFGLSRLCSQHQPFVATADWGTVPYMAGEYLDNKLYKSSDVYSFGVLVWQMYTGKMPFAGHHEAQVAAGVMLGNLHLDWPPSMLPPLLRLGQACCRHEPEQRPTFKDCVVALAGMETLLRQDAARHRARAAPTTTLAQGPATPPPPAYHPHPHPHPHLHTHAHHLQDPSNHHLHCHVHSQHCTSPPPGLILGRLLAAGGVASPPPSAAAAMVAGVNPETMACSVSMDVPYNEGCGCGSDAYTTASLSYSGVMLSSFAGGGDGSGSVHDAPLRAWEPSLYGTGTIGGGGWPVLLAPLSVGAAAPMPVSAVAVAPEVGAAAAAAAAAKTTTSPPPTTTTTMPVSVSVSAKVSSPFDAVASSVAAVGGPGPRATLTDMCALVGVAPTGRREAGWGNVTAGAGEVPGLFRYRSLDAPGTAATVGAHVADMSCRRRHSGTGVSTHGIAGPGAAAASAVTTTAAAGSCACTCSSGGDGGGGVAAPGRSPAAAPQYVLPWLLPWPYSGGACQPPLSQPPCTDDQFAEDTLSASDCCPQLTRTASAALSGPSTNTSTNNAVTTSTNANAVMTTLNSPSGSQDASCLSGTALASPAAGVLAPALAPASVLGLQASHFSGPGMTPVTGAPALGASYAYPLGWKAPSRFGTGFSRGVGGYQGPQSRGSHTQSQRFQSWSTGGVQRPGPMRRVTPVSTKRPTRGLWRGSEGPTLQHVSEDDGDASSGDGGDGAPELLSPPLAVPTVAAAPFLSLGGALNGGSDSGGGGGGLGGK